jgi:iron complex outermembrane receptor protein
MTQNKIQLLAVASVLALATAPHVTMAQVAASAARAEADSDAIVVTGLRASLRDAIMAKRNSAVVTEVISSKDIGVMPDVTIADELNRLPGVTASRDRGNASQASVRGLGPRLVLGLVNGREVASSEPDRNVRWEIYPSEAVSGVTVYKSQGADLIAGGVAATIDIRTLRPLDYVGPKLTARAGVQANDAGFKIPGYDGMGTRGSAQFVTRLTDTLGLALGGTYQKQSNGYGSFQGWGYNTGSDSPTLGGKPINAPWGAQTEVKALKETRWSTTGALQWKPDDHWEASVDFLYSNVKIAEKQYQQWYGGWGDWQGTIPDSTYQTGQYTLAGNSIVGAKIDNWKTTVTNVLAKYTEDKTLLAAGTNLRYRADDLMVKFDGSYSQAIRNNLWQALEWNVYPQSVTFNTAAGVAPSISTPVDLTGGPQAFAGQGLTGPQRLVDTLGAAQVDVNYKLHGGVIAAVNAGLRYSKRVKSFDSQSGGTVSLGNPASFSFTSFSLNGAGFTAPNMLYADYDRIAALSLAGISQDKSQYWHVAEEDFEGYVMAELAGDLGAVPFSGNIGLRAVDVGTTSNAYQAVTSWNGTANVTAYNPISTPSHYTRVLPSLNLNFELSPQLKLRAGVARVMSRPPLDELRASSNLSYYPPSYLQGSSGNPKLKPFMATQGDLSLEYYFHKDAVIALAGFYKDVDSSVGYTSYSQSFAVNGVATPFTISGPANGKGGYIAGTELSLSTPFYFVPALSNFGIYANVAITESDLKEMTPTANPFAAVGMTKFTGQVDLWYSGHGVDARIGVKRHSPQTVIFGWDATKLTRLEAETTVGASISYAVTKAISLRVQANNITNQAARFYYANDVNQLARYEKYGRSYLADVTFKF